MANGITVYACASCACVDMNIGFHVWVGRFLLSFCLLLLLLLPYVVAAFVVAVVILFKWNSTAAQRTMLVLVLYLVRLVLFVFVNELLSMDGSHGVCMRDCVRLYVHATKRAN